LEGREGGSGDETIAESSVFLEKK